MRRYQLYLDPHSVSVLDDFEKETNISRSRLIREAIDRLADNLAKVFVATIRGSSAKKAALDALVGCVKGPAGQTDFASTDKHIYLRD